WEEGRVYARLAQGAWPRKVSRRGQIGVYGRVLGVGQRYAGQEVVLRLGEATVAWVITDQRGQEVRRHPAGELSRERILALAVVQTAEQQVHRRARRGRLRLLAAPPAGRGAGRKAA